MSRKDHRKLLHVPLSRAELTWLRKQARGRSLGDALRRAVSGGLAGAGAASDDLPSDDLAAGKAVTADVVRVLPVQLPRPVRLSLAASAVARGRSEAEVARALVARAIVDS